MIRFTEDIYELEYDPSNNSYSFDKNASQMKSKSGINAQEQNVHENKQSAKKSKRSRRTTKTKGNYIDIYVY